MAESAPQRKAPACPQPSHLAKGHTSDAAPVTGKKIRNRNRNRHEVCEWGGERSKGNAKKGEGGELKCVGEKT